MDCAVRWFGRLNGLPTLFNEALGIVFLFGLHRHGLQRLMIGDAPGYTAQELDQQS
jgi:hypothetical protein